MNKWLLEFVKNFFFFYGSHSEVATSVSSSWLDDKIKVTFVTEVLERRALKDKLGTVSIISNIEFPSSRNKGELISPSQDHLDSSTSPAVINK